MNRVVSPRGLVVRDPPPQNQKKVRVVVRVRDQRQELRMLRESYLSSSVLFSPGLAWPRGLLARRRDGRAEEDSVRDCENPPLRGLPAPPTASSLHPQHIQEIPSLRLLFNLNLGFLSVRMRHSFLT